MLINNLVENLETQVISHTGLLQALKDELNMTAHCTLDDLNNIHRDRDQITKEIF